MSKSRLEAFSDGVLAIVITIMVLELRPPDGAALDALAPLWPKLLAYVLSFVYLGIYWVNHHHLLHAVNTISGAALWANLHLLFWLSLVPAGTAWIGQTGFASLPVALYGFVLLMPAVAYTILVVALVRAPGQTPTLASALGSDRKGKLSIALYALSIPVAFVVPFVSVAIFIVVAAMWFVPDRRLEGRPGTLSE
ncbi:MAG TPA: TMEM175 family protein [Candidatus Limnocylindrales bacterium]